jgi:NAD-dependent deacetylase
MRDAFQRIGAQLKAARRVLFITGAGVSAESGIPTFRGNTSAFTGGVTEEGTPFEESLSGPAFQRDPAQSWKYFLRLDQALRGKEPNAAHRAIAALEAAGRQVCVVTQNIDGLHQRAGSRRVLELHGNLLRLVCTGCAYAARCQTFEGLPPLPRCPDCRQVLRPDIVLYEEELPEVALAEFAFEREKGFDLIFTVGTTSLFSYVVAPVLMAAQADIPTVEINPEETTLSRVVEFRFPAAAGPTLQKLLEAAAA